MGLDAMVYKRLSNLPSGPPFEGVRMCDPTTGELQFPDRTDRLGPSMDLLFAADERIGNLSHVRWLREEVTKRCPESPVLLEQFVYSGSHSGEFIPLEQTDTLNQEIESLYRINRPIPDHVSVFIAQVRRLIVASKAEGNPIVFI